MLPGNVRVLSSPAELAAIAAARAAEVVREAVAEKGRARLLLATGNSQVAFMGALVARPDIPWARVEALHIDEYVGIPADHPASFRRWIRTRFEEKARPATVHYLAGDAANPATEAARYGRLLREAPIDLAFVGFGENGHIGFNDPGFADFDDPLAVRVVALEEASRRQQVGEGHFPDLAAVPTHAMTVSCSGLFSARAWICCVPEARKARAVREAVLGPVSTRCPASLFRRHPRADVFLEPASASLLSDS